MFKKATLLNSAGEFVVSVFLPPFDKLPEVIQWEFRFFKKTSENQFTECFAYIMTSGYDSVDPFMLSAEERHKLSLEVE